MHAWHIGHSMRIMHTMLNRHSVYVRTYARAHSGISGDWARKLFRFSGCGSCGIVLCCSRCAFISSLLLWLVRTSVDIRVAAELRLRLAAPSHDLGAMAHIGNWHWYYYEDAKGKKKSQVGKIHR